MNRRLMLAGLAATGGLLTTALLQVAIAAAEPVPPTPGVDAFTIGNYTFDPQLSGGGEGFDPVAQLTNTPPLLQIGGGDALPVSPQSFDVYNPANGDLLGNITGNETVTNLLGFSNAEFVVAAPDDGSTLAAGLPTAGSVYDVFNLGNGYANVYTATPSVGGAPGTVTDTFVTPHGDMNLDSLFGGINAADPINPGDAFTGLDVSGITGAPEAFSIGGFTLDPLAEATQFTTVSLGPVTGEGWTLLTPLVAVPPLLEIGGGSLSDPAAGDGNLATQTFEVYSGSGSSATELGTIDTGEDSTNLLGLINTQLVVTDVTPVGDSTAGLPAVGTVLDATNLGNGYENVYTATPDITTDAGTTPGTVTDTLVTPYGNINLDSLVGGFNVANPLDPSAALTGLQAGDSAIGADAFTLDGFTFDPQLVAGGEGFDPVYQLVGAPPLLNLGGALIFGSLKLAPQDFNVYDGSGSTATEVGSITTSENVSDILGFTNTSFTVTDVNPISDATPLTDLPTQGTVYDVLNLGALENIYTAIPGVDGAADTVTDTLVTPFGSLDLSSLFAGIDAAAALNPGDAFDFASSAVTEAATGAATAIDPLAFLGL